MALRLVGGIVFTLLFSGAAVALASAEDAVPYVGVGGLYEVPDSARKADDGYGFRIRFGLPLQEHSALEISVFDLQRSRHIDGRNDYAQGLWLDYVYDFGLFGFRADWLPDFKPYLLAGPGLYRDDARGHAHYNPGLDAGGGVAIPLHFGDWDWGWSLRTEARAVLQYNSHDFPDTRVPVDVQLEAGLEIPLTFWFKPATRSAAPSPLLDCAHPVIDPVTGRSDCPGDADHDGVTDAQDRCPDTPAGTPVDEHGCALVAVPDEDGDAVPDASDQCLHTPPGVKVDAKGCAVAQTAVFDDVRFELNSAVLTGQATQVLQRLARALAAQPNLRLEIGGYTDASGSPAHNKILSEQRAESVRQYLIAQGVEAARLSTRAYGAAQPRSANDSESGREANRRVEFGFELR